MVPTSSMMHRAPTGKRILFVLPGLELGGAERQALLLARYLKEQGNDVRVWGHTGPGLAADHCDDMGIPWRVQPSTWPCRKRNWPRLPFRVLRFLRALRRERPDIILAYCPRPCISTGLTWRWSGARVCIWGQRDTDDLRGDWIERYAYRHVSAVVCNAEHEVSYLNRSFGDAVAPVHVVHNGIKLKPILRTRAEWREGLGISEESPVVTMLANFRAHQKDHPTLLRAWRILMDAPYSAKSVPRLILAGAEQESYPAVRGLAKQLGLLDTVIFPGQVKDVSGLLGASDIGVLATTHEGLPNAVLEYMAAGLPVVATDIPGTREALANGLDVQLCSPNDSRALAATIGQLIRSPELRGRVGESNRRRARREFSPDAMCSRMASVVFQRLAAAT